MSDVDLSAMYGDPERVRDAIAQDRAWIWRCADGFAVLATEINDFGERELFVWGACGRGIKAHVEDMKRIAREKDCKRVVTRVVNNAMLRMLQRNGWQPRSVELVMEV